MTTQKPQKDLTIPKYHRRVMVFDTETSGLMPRHKAGTPFPPMEAYPYIMQISWIVYNVSSNQIEEVVNEYVQIPDEAPISPESIQVHGITREVTKEKGKPITQLLAKFFVAYMKCDCIIAHNLQFDSELVRKEMWRNQKDLEKVISSKERINMMCGVFTKKFNAAYHIDTFCTMMNTIQFCNIDFVAKPAPTPAPVDENVVADDVCGSPKSQEPATEPKCDSVVVEVAPLPKPPKKKFPRLNELYSKLFEGALPTDLHNSIVDVLVCLRCFLKVRGVTEMSELEFQTLIEKYSRPETNIN